MTITVNSAVLSSGQPSAPLRAVKINVDLDASSPAGGYDISSQLEGGTVVHGTHQLDYDGSALRWLQIGTDNKVHAFADTNGAPGTELAGTTDLSGHTGVELFCFVQ